MAFWPGGAFASTFRLVAVLFIAVAQCGCWEGTARETLATVLSVEGNAEVSSDDGRTFSPLLPSHTVDTAAIVRTALETVSLTLLPNSLVHLDRETSLQIVRVTLVKNGNETGADILGRFAEVKLISGRLFASHVWGGARARLAIGTANGEVSTPSNASFWVESAEGKTRVTCVSGWVEFRPSGATGSTRILPGSIGRWPSAGENVSAADADPRGQDDLQRAMELEQRMRDLLREKRNVLPR